MNLTQDEQIKDLIEFNRRFSGLSERGQIMVLAYLSALCDKESVDSSAPAAEQSRQGVINEL